MKYKELIYKILLKVLYPIENNKAFFVFMYILGILCEMITVPTGGSLYDNLWLELFLDIYVVCIILTIIPTKIRRWVHGIFYFLAYTVSVVDVFCFVKYDSTINPSILMLVGETDSREAGEFLTTIFSSDIVFSGVGLVLLLMLIHILIVTLPILIKRCSFVNVNRYRIIENVIGHFYKKIRIVLSVLCLVLFIVSIVFSAHNKAATLKLMTGSSIGEIEHTLTESDHAVLITPLYRLSFSIYANELASKQIGQLISAADKVKVDSCTFKSPTIVLIIGESYGRHHSEQYGYFMNTTPRQSLLEKRGYLSKFNNVVTCWNLTSFVFKNVFSMHVVGQKGEWCDYPLFPELFRKAGYHVTFLTNQFMPKAQEAVYDFSGGFFLNNPVLSKAQFDTRNDELYRYDDGLLQCYDNMNDNKHEFDKNPNNLFIFHLIGQHVTYKTRYPSDRVHFWASDYEEKRPELTDHQRKVLSQYDNACLYNDSIVDQIVKRFSNKDAIVIYMPDHGEECYEGNRGFICRNHSADIDYDLAHYEFEVPFWIYCSQKYITRHPKIYREIRAARNNKFMTDALPHMLVYLAGIYTKDYHPQYNVLSDYYDENRPRILKGTTNYDKLRPTKTVTGNK
nr:phosphoethanolamine transferase [Prevotella sp.]